MHRNLHPVANFIRLFVLSVLTLAVMNAQAQPLPHIQLAELSLSEAAGQAQRQFGGDVIKANPVRIQGKKAYRIRIVQPNGRVREMTLDATNGQRMGRKRKP